MKTVDSTTRANFLSAASSPRTSATIRRSRLDFGASPHVGASTQLASRAGDDFYGRYILGMAGLGGDGYAVRIVNLAAAGQSSDWYHSRTNTPHTAANWEYTDTSGGPTISAYCRPGAYPSGSASIMNVFYADTSDDAVYIRPLTMSSGSWGTVTATGATIAAFDSVALHPISDDTAFVVGYTEPYLWVDRVYWSGSAWSTLGTHVVACIPDVDPFSRAQFSGVAPVGSTGIYCIVVTMGQAGSVYSIRYDEDAEMFSQPTLAAGANADWGGLRAFVSGAAWINDKVWAVTSRAIESSDGEPQAYHNLLLSSPDGLHWREEDFIGIAPCYGTPLVHGNYIYVAGNACVYESDATIKVGVDNPSLSTDVDDVMAWSLALSSNGPGVLQMPAVLGDNTTVDTDLLEPGAEVEVTVWDDDGSDVDLFSGYVEMVTNIEAYAQSTSKRVVKGPISRLAGGSSYHHPVGMGFDAPIVYNTDFNSDNGLARISVRQVTGKFKVNYNPDRGRWEVEGEDGVALIPTSVRTQWLQAQMHAVPMQSVNGLFIVFYYEDIDNYWRAGLLRAAGSSSYDLVIQQRVGGEWTTRDTTSSVGSSSEVEMSMLLTLKPGDVTIRVNVNSSSDDYTGSSEASFNTFASLVEVPMPHHVGVECSPIVDHAGADSSGTVESATDNTITDTGVFSTSDAGKYIFWNDEWRRIVSATTNTATVSPFFSSVPQVGDTFGVYPDNRGPYSRLLSFKMCDGNQMWTVGDVAESIMQMAGVTMHDKETTSVGALGTGDVYMYDIDLSLSEDCTVAIHATDGASPSYWAVEIDGANSEITLKRYDAGTPTTIAVYPTLLDISDADVSFRLVHYLDNVYVYACNHYIGCFWDVKTAGSGRVAASSGTVAQSEFPSMCESFVWDAAKPATSAIASLLRGRPAKMVECSEGTSSDLVKVSRFESRDDLGTWSTTVLQMENSESAAPSLIEMEGEDTREYHLDPEQARERLLFRRARSEFARGTQQTRAEARRISSLGKEEARPGLITMALMDPAAQPEDEVTVDSTDYIITKVQMQAGYGREGLQWGAKYAVREKQSSFTGGVWGTDSWDDFKWG